MRFTFRRAERLKSVRTINELYKSGVTGYVYPFRYSYLVCKSEKAEQPARIMIAVSRKRVPRATARNLVRRRIREAYRLNRHVFSDTLYNENIYLALIITYIGDGTDGWGTIVKKIVILLQDINAKLKTIDFQQ